MESPLTLAGIESWLSASFAFQTSAIISSLLVVDVANSVGQLLDAIVDDFPRLPSKGRFLGGRPRFRFVGVGVVGLSATTVVVVVMDDDDSDARDTTAVGWDSLLEVASAMAIGILVKDGGDDDVVVALWVLVSTLSCFMEFDNGVCCEFEFALPPFFL